MFAFLVQKGPSFPQLQGVSPCHLSALSATALPPMQSFLSRLSQIASWLVLKPLGLPSSTTPFHQHAIKAILLLCEIFPTTSATRTLSCLGTDHSGTRIKTLKYHCSRNQGTRASFTRLTNICCASAICLYSTGC